MKKAGSESEHTPNKARRNGGHGGKKGHAETPRGKERHAKALRSKERIGEEGVHGLHGLTRIEEEGENEKR